MPVTPGMSFVDTKTEVRARCGEVDDGVSNPIFDLEAGFHINSAQRQLVVTAPWLRKTRTGQKDIASGQRYFDLPEDARYGQIRALRWASGIARLPLTPGINRDEQGAVGISDRYDLSPSTGAVTVDITAGGSGYADQTAVISGGSRSSEGADPVVEIGTTSGVITSATITDSGAGWTEAPSLVLTGGTGGVLAVNLGNVQVVELAPLNNIAGTIEFDYLAGVVRLEDDDDELSLDDEAVIGFASWLMASTKRLAFASNILAAHNAYMNRLGSQQNAGRVSSLSAWRRDYAAQNDVRLVRSSSRR